jgi:hypothetical protein
MVSIPSSVACSGRKRGNPKETDREGWLQLSLVLAEKKEKEKLLAILRYIAAELSTGCWWICFFTEKTECC